MNLLFIASAKIAGREGNTSSSSLYGAGVDQGNENRKRVQDFLLLPQGFENLHMVKPIVIGFRSNGG